jgi:hypothetical protein
MAKVIDTFVAITHRIIAQDGFENYLPTLLLPTTKKIAVLEGAPRDSTLEKIVRRWAEESAGSEADYVVAFKSDEKHFDVIARIEGEMHERREVVGGA